MAEVVATPLLAQLVAHDDALARTGFLHPDCAARLYPAASDVPQRGVVALMHGFTAGPWQFRELCERLRLRGLHCFAARLPGHGATARATATAPLASFSPHALPKSRQAHHFAECADRALAAAHEHAQAHNLPLMLVGFSAGGALVADLLLRSPVPVARAVLIAPLLTPLGRSRRLFFRLMSRLPLGGRIIDRVPFSWRPQAPRADGWVRPGHSSFHLGNVSALFAYAHGLRTSRRMWTTPSQFILTANDDKIDPFACRTMAQRGSPPHPVWWFGPERKVPHAMLSREENGDSHSREELHALIESFLLDGVGHSNC